MKKIYYLRNAGDFRLLFYRGEKQESPFFRVLTRRNEAGHARFAYITPRALDKRSSVRNRLRRRAREWIRQQGPELLKKPLDVAIVFKKRAAAYPRKNFYEELERIFTKIDG